MKTLLKAKTTKITTSLKAKANVTASLRVKPNVTANATIELKENDARVLLGSTVTSVATTRVAKSEAATVNGKAEDSATQIVMQMRYLHRLQHRQ